MFRKIIALSVLSICICTYNAAAENYADMLMVADFNSDETRNNIGDIFGTWDYDPMDDTQTCLMEFSDQDVNGKGAGKSLRLTYDVQSPNPAFNGLWMKLNSINVEEYNRLVFWVKGDPAKNFTSRFKVELKNALGNRAIYMVKGVTSEWTEVSIQFKNNRAIQDWTQMSEFTVVFDDVNSTFREGVISIDNVAFALVDEE